MKKNKYVTKSVAGTVATSILINSCSPALIEDPLSRDIDIIYKTNLISNDWGSIAIPISFNLQVGDANYMFFLQKLAMDIINNPQIAQRFIEDPSAFLNKYGCNIPLNLDEETLKLVLALGDSDINVAIKNNNVSLFLDLCKEKDLFISTENAFSHLYDNPEIQAKLVELGFDDLEIIFTPYFPIVFVAVVIAISTVVVYIVAYDEVYVAGSATLNSLRGINPILTVWALKGDPDYTYVAASELVERQIEAVIDFIKRENPSYFENNSEANLRALLKMNAF